MVSPPGVRGGGQRLHGFQDVGALHLQVYKDQERSADFSGTGLHRTLHRYVDHPGSKVADSQSGLSDHQSFLTPRCPFMRSMHQLCWPVNNSANGCRCARTGCCIRDLVPHASRSPRRDVVLWPLLSHKPQEYQPWDARKPTTEDGATRPVFTAPQASPAACERSHSSSSSTFCVSSLT